MRWISANDTKLCRLVMPREDLEEVQRDRRKPCHWAAPWQMKTSADQGRAIHMESSEVNDSSISLVSEAKARLVGPSGWSSGAGASYSESWRSSRGEPRVGAGVRSQEQDWNRLGSRARPGLKIPGQWELCGSGAYRQDQPPGHRFPVQCLSR